MLAIRQRIVDSRSLVPSIAGSVLLLAGHALTRVHWQPLCEYWYGVVWLGFILASEGIVGIATRHSLLLDRPRELLRMFLVSAALWWLVEIANAVFFGSWRYTASPEVPSWVQYLRSTAFFSLLLPATWEAMILGAWAMRVAPGALDTRSPLTRAERWVCTASVGVGTAVVVGLSVGFAEALRLPASLVAALLVLDGLNGLSQKPSLACASLTSAGRRFIASLVVSNLLLGLLSEMWNHEATPQWRYDAPYAGSIRLFGMPIFGYAGYVLLAMVLFAAYHRTRPKRTARSAPGSLPSDHPSALTGLH